eukprot:Hpha_TRINITY_DN16811_c3_g1::TRINITY_DN16811_c3_g1_i1::g.151275::m.151275/K04886/KCNB2; potassium voltage-gated channel Shab-related subfamily B member 2
MAAMATVAMAGQRRRDSQSSEDSVMSRGDSMTFQGKGGKRGKNSRWNAGDRQASGEERDGRLGSLGDLDHPQRGESSRESRDSAHNAGTPPHTARGDVMIEDSDQILREESEGCYPEPEWPEGLSDGPHHMAKLLEKQARRLPLSRRLHALFDAEGPVEELYADRHLAVTRTLFFTSFSMILISVAVMSVESLPEYFNQSYPIFFWMETVCIAWFTMELFIRFATTQARGEFVRTPLNIIDFAAIFPYYLENFILKYAYTGGSGGTDGLLILRVVRLTRVFRVFKLSKYDEGVQVVFTSLKKSTDALSLLIFLTALAMVLFGALIFVAEQSAAEFNVTTRTWVRKPEYGGPSEKHKINSIPIGFWWCLVTLTTVGYGDMYPVTLFGYIVGAMAMMAGLLIVAFPIIIIGANFTEVREEWRANQAMKKLNAPKHKKKELVDKGPDIGGAAAHALGPALSTHLTEMAAKPRHFREDNAEGGDERMLRSNASGLGNLEARMGKLSFRFGTQRVGMTQQVSIGPGIIRTAPGAAGEGAGDASAGGAGDGAAPPAAILPPVVNLREPATEEARLAIPSHPPPDPPDQSREAVFLAQQLLQRLSRLEETISQVVADTVQDELKALRRAADA